MEAIFGISKIIIFFSMLLFLFIAITQHIYSLILYSIILFMIFLSMLNSDNRYNQGIQKLKDEGRI